MHDDERRSSPLPELSSAETATSVARAAADGEHVARVDLAECIDGPSAIARLAEALAFPAWFGGNWDALEDALRDLSWLPAPGYLVVVEHADALRAAAPAALATLCDVLASAGDETDVRGAPLRAILVRDVD